MGAKKHEYKQLFEKIDQEEDGEVYLRYIWGLNKAFLENLENFDLLTCFSSWPWYTLF